MKSFLSLVKLGIGHSASIPTHVDWVTTEALAAEQGLSAIVLDGIEELPLNKRPPQELLLQWIGEVLGFYENNYVEYEKAIGRLAHFYNRYGFQMMVIKGYGLSLNYPRPSHRPCGDIDIWLFGKQKDADAALAENTGIQIDGSHHHHTVFEWDRFTVENHYDFINVHHQKSSLKFEAIFKELGKDDSYKVDVNGETVYLPSPNLHALFLIRHMANHFVGANITLRQVLDWAFFVKESTEEIDWVWLENILEQYHMMDFYNCLNAICVEDLGFCVDIFHQAVQFNTRMKERVLNDILFPTFSAEEPHGFTKRLIYKFRRWNGNAWKHGLCNRDSRSSALLYGIWNHLLKPSSI